MASKALLLLGLLAFLLIASDVAARDLAETSAEKNDKAMKEAQHPDQNPGGYGSRGGYIGGGCQYGCCRNNGLRNCARCCAYVGEVPESLVTKY